MPPQEGGSQGPLQDCGSGGPRHNRGNDNVAIRRHSDTREGDRDSKLHRHRQRHRPRGG